MEDYTRKAFIDHMGELENAYYDVEKSGLKGINAKNNVSMEFETGVIEDYLKKHEVNLTIVGWKAGRLEKCGQNYQYKLFTDQKRKRGYLNGYGRLMSQKELKKFLAKVKSNTIKYDLKNYNLNDYIAVFRQNYERILKCKVPSNFGTVYVINLIYFLSGGVFPIYDKFAHKALKGLYWEVNPCNCYVGDAPEKGKINDVIALYREYIWLIDQLFGIHEYIKSRKTDRALWAYGHATHDFSYN